MVGVIISLVFLVAMFVVWCCVQLLFRFDLTNAVLVSGLIQLLTIDRDWSVVMRCVTFFVLLAVCLVMQNASKILRFLFAVFSTSVIAIMGYVWIAYDTREQQLAVTAVCIIVGILLNCFCWARKKGQMAYA